MGNIIVAENKPTITQYVYTQTPQENGIAYQYNGLPDVIQMGDYSAYPYSNRYNYGGGTNSEIVTSGNTNESKNGICCYQKLIEVPPKPPAPGYTMVHIMRGEKLIGSYIGGAGQPFRLFYSSVSINTSDYIVGGYATVYAMIGGNWVSCSVNVGFSAITEYMSGINAMSIADTPKQLVTMETIVT